MSSHDEIATRLYDAARSRRPIEAPTSEQPDLTVEDAYAIQKLTIDRRLREPGGHGRRPRLVGWKIGITSRAVQSWLGVTEPDFGHLLDDMEVPNGGMVPTEQLLQPRVEGEIAFLLRRSLVGPGLTTACVLGAIEVALPAIEIIDSRVVDWRFRIQDTIADNASSALFVLGSAPLPMDQMDLGLIGCTLRRNGRVVSTGAGAACLGHPVNALVWLANRLGELGEQLHAGQVVLSGALGPVSPVAAGDRISVTIGTAPEVRVGFE